MKYFYRTLNIGAYIMIKRFFRSNKNQIEDMINQRSKEWYFMSFDPRITGSKKLRYAIVDGDDHAIELVKRTILKAIAKEMKSYTNSGTD